jgi:type IV secretory pathway VirB2 component (pilin)
MLNRLRTRISAVALMAFAMCLMAMPAFADTGGSAINAAVDDVTSDALAVITGNYGKILLVVGGFVALKIGKRLINRV